MQFDESNNMVIVEFHDLTPEAQKTLIMGQKLFSKSHNLELVELTGFMAYGTPVNVDFEG